MLGTGELEAFLARGIPAVTYGAGSVERLLRPDEYIEISELINQTKIYAITALNICGFHK